MPEIDAHDCPKCDDGTKGHYDGRVLIGGRGIYTCQRCGTRWQDANERPATCGVTPPLVAPSTREGDGER